ncbi:MAG: peptidoglycan-binding protein [Clostridia bacterium]|nr:peptidoglycan-binding protein [Clostridia bacterium]
MEVPEEAPATEEAAPAETPAPEANRLQVFVEANIIKAAQQALNAAGYDCGTPDGVMGNNTRSSLSAYQQAQGLTVTGTPTYETLVALGVMK